MEPPEDMLEKEETILVPKEINAILVSHGIDTVEKLQTLFEPNLYAVIPVSILERTDLSANAKLLYAEIVALSKRSGVCFATNEYLAARIGLAKDSIKSLVSELFSKSLIFVDIDRSPKGTYRTMRVVWGAGLGNPGGEGSITPGGGAREPRLKRNIKREIKYTAPQSVAPLKADSFFNASKKKDRADDGETMAAGDFVLLCRGSQYRHIRLIAEYADERKLTFLTRGQWREFGRRNLRAARQLSPYTDRQIEKAMKAMERDLQPNGGFISKWTLETLIKYLDQTSN